MKGKAFTAAFALAFAAMPGVPARAEIRVDLSGVGVQLGRQRAQVPGVGETNVIPLPEQAGNTEGGWANLAAKVAARNPGIPEPALRKAFRYMAQHDIANPNYVGIINFDQPSNEKRFSVIRTADGSVQTYLVAHGKGSGDRYATRFSDTPESHMSSLGLYLTGEEYEGKHGRSLKLHGMDPSNNMAESRSVVIHEADYVTDEYVARRGMAGRSWGCPAVDPQHLDAILNQLRAGAVLVIHHSSQGE